MKKIPGLRTYTLFEKPFKNSRGRTAAFSRSAALSERRLLSRIQIRLILWYIIAFLAFEDAIVAGTYFVLRQHVMDSARQAIVDEWAQKVPEALDQIKLETRDGSWSTNVDSAPEVIASWIVSENDQITTKDLSLASAPGSLVPIFTPIIEQSRHATTEIWAMNHVGQVSVLTAAHPLFVEGQYVGTIISAYSLRSMQRTLQTLIQIDIELGLASILVIVPITYLLSRRSLQPIRVALQRQRSFVNDAAHELRTPLTILQGTLELAQHETDVTQLHEAISESIAEATYISRLVGDLSTLARLQSGSTSISLVTLDIAIITQQTVDAMQALAEPKDLTLTCSGCAQELLLFGDATRLRQLLVILIENAVKYNHQGGQVEVRLSRHRYEAQISVSDTGIGIPAKDLSHVFDHFYRATEAERHTSGSGIGLAIAAWIVSSHGGQIEVASREGAGTKFTVWVPIGNRHRLKK